MDFCNKLERLSFKFFQPSPMFKGKAGAYHRVELQPYPQTLDLDGKACQGQTSLLQKSKNYGQKVL
jgi:hypothetical protein